MDDIKKEVLSGEYIAGFIDGEGYIGITFQRKKETSYQSASVHYHPYLIIANNNYKILNDIKKFVGSGYIYKLSRKNYKQKQSFQYKLTKMEPLKHLLEFIQPYLRIKQKQCELLLTFIDTRKNAKRIYGPYRGATSYTIEEEIYQKLLNLNKRGQ
jgi:hypothetical protein